jgi:hypothetical protein
MAIFKVTITVIALLETDTPEEAKEEIDIRDLAEIERETTDGLWLGTHKLNSIVEVPQDNVREECAALGNDGSFFEMFGDDDNVGG